MSVIINNRIENMKAKLKYFKWNITIIKKNKNCVKNIIEKIQEISRALR